MNYKASLSRRQKISTLLVLVIVVGFNQWGMIASMLGDLNLNYYFPEVIFLDLLFIYLFLISPRNYSVTNDELIISRIIRKRYIPFANIEKIEQIPAEDLKWSLRTFGVGGYFGRFGQFTNRKFGSMTWYVTQRINFLMITTRTGEQIVLTPDDASMFNEIQNYLSLR